MKWILLMFTLMTLSAHDFDLNDKLNKNGQIITSQGAFNGVAWSYHYQDHHLSLALDITLQAEPNITMSIKQTGNASRYADGYALVKTLRKNFNYSITVKTENMVYAIESDDKLPREAQKLMSDLYGDFGWRSRPFGDSNITTPEQIKDKLIRLRESLKPFAKLKDNQHALKSQPEEIEELEHLASKFYATGRPRKFLAMLAKMVLRTRSEDNIVTCNIKNYLDNNGAGKTKKELIQIAFDNNRKVALNYTWELKPGDFVLDWSNHKALHIKMLEGVYNVAFAHKAKGEYCGESYCRACHPDSQYGSGGKGDQYSFDVPGRLKALQLKYPEKWLKVKATILDRLLISK